MQQISLLLTSLPDGILLGFVYGLAAMGLTLIWGVMNVINLSHGPIIALGMFGTFFLFTRAGLNRCPSRHQRAASLIAAGNLFGEHDHHRAGHGRVHHLPI
jgi:branched-subunit amino acid ABC-type transport system permease component